MSRRMGSNEIVCFSRSKAIRKLAFGKRLDVYNALVTLVDDVRNHFRRFLELTSESVFRSHLSS